MPQSLASTNDIALAELIRTTVASIGSQPGPSGKPAGRFGDRKVFVSALWSALQATGHPLVALCTIDHLKTWLLRAMRLRDDSGRFLALLARADLVAAMDHEAVVASEISDRGATFHFVQDTTVS